MRTTGDYSLVQTDALRKLVDNLRAEARSLEARGRDSSRVRSWLEEAERELATR